jgi:hypothetical protein
MSTLKPGKTYICNHEDILKFAEFKQNILILNVRRESRL